MRSEVVLKRIGMVYVKIHSFHGNPLKGTYQGFSFFIANSFYMSDFMYLLRTQIIFHNVQ